MRPWLRKVGLAALVFLPILLLYTYLVPPRVSAGVVVVSQAAALSLVRGKWAKAGMTVLLVCSVLMLGLILLLMRRGPYVSVATRSPDASVTAEIFELPAWIDRNFQLRLKTYLMGVMPRRQIIFRSADEGEPPGEERLLWSKDGRHLLLVGKHLFPTNRECLSSGEWLYLLYDRQANLVMSNTRTSPQEGVSFRFGFTVRDLTGLDFGAQFAPGVVVESRSAGPKCQPDA